MLRVTGTLIASFYVCKREVWLMSRELIPDQDNSFLEIGRLVEENFYKRESKGFNVGNIKIDIVRKGSESILIGEVKKSSRYEKPAIMQLAFYLLKLKESGIKSEGEILIPKERKRIKVILTEEIETELKNTIREIEKIIQQDKPLPKERIKFCTNCAYREFCWS
ncbi:MAG: CRISPR-associated protein Cas4 [Candidatus Latescibacterota bacterium]|nr:MAG: CRISPR-associated protein Cas4 [Candidatus Latescibacterota bacterium]